MNIPEAWDKEHDIVIIGTGYAGLTAAIEAHDTGASTLLIEKMALVGGNSIRSGGGANAVDPQRQLVQGITDSTDFHYTQTLKEGEGLGDPEKIRYVVDNALEMCVEWLEHLGVEWPRHVVRGYGALWERTHVPAKYQKYRRGAAILYAILDAVKARGITICLSHTVTKILREHLLEGEVVGVEVDVAGRHSYFKARNAVILASGGFGADLGMVIDHDPRLMDTPTTCHSGSTGECLKMAQDIGADVVGMDYIQCVPTIARSPYQGRFFIISSEETRERGTPYHIFVNNMGYRFVREDGRRDEITFAAMAQPSFEPLPTITANSIPKLETQLSIPQDHLILTMEKYASYCKNGRDSDFHKHQSTLIPCNTPPFKAQSLTPGRHHTMGGLKIRGITGRVVDRWGEIIPHLYAAGEVTGGIHGANRLGFNAIPESIVFGRTVGKFAAQQKV
ncbi:MAG: FAD-dependent oxidoreductase [Candidatus Bathyarchaeota archaeon]|nr:FAD-dependent oxidoreductase [Candidatus Bathyarchaeota archaeon]